VQQQSLSQPQPQPPPQQQTPQQQDLFSLLLGAAEQAAAAASGLTADLSASFSALLDTLPPEQQAAEVRGGPPCLLQVGFGLARLPAEVLTETQWCMQETRLRLLVRQGLYGAAAQLMTTALRLAGA
jgi:hypothetical protein